MAGPFWTDSKSLLFESIADLLDIPPSYYKKARDRYRSLGDWLHRDESKVAALNPEVYSQGSFRYGTVNQPLLKTEEYDLDLVCEVILSKDDVTQKHVKHLLGEEIKAYAQANGIKAPVIERNRCWRLDYADKVLFHMDALPCVPEDQQTIDDICGQGVPRELAGLSIAITDKKGEHYDDITGDWPCSNPRGIGNWFEEKARPSATKRLYELVEQRAYKSIDEIPSYEWKTPLQRAIQILKRHRDVMFATAPDFAPISMIITVLAGQAYQGETSLYAAIKGIVDRLPEHVASTKPRIPNPVNHGEDFTDRWASDSRYEKNFWLWHTAVNADVENLPALLGDERLVKEVRKSFRVDLTEDQTKELTPRIKVPAEAKAVPTIHIGSAPKPWQHGG